MKDVRNRPSAVVSSCRVLASCLAMILGFSSGQAAACRVDGVGRSTIFAGTVARVPSANMLQLTDGTQLRLAGLVPPSAFDVGAEPGRWPAEISALDTLREILEGRDIEAITPAAANVDRHGRHAAEVFLAAGDRQWVQGLVLARGMARYVTEAAHRACTEAGHEREWQARQAGLGIWAEAAYQPLKLPVDPQHIERLIGSFQVIKGHPAGIIWRQREALVVLAGQGLARTRGSSSLAILADADILKKLGFEHGSGLNQKNRGRLLEARGWLEPNTERKRKSFSAPALMRIGAMGSLRDVSGESKDRK